MRNLHQLREARGWSQLDLAVRAGVSVAAISNWERGVAVPSEANWRRPGAVVPGRAVAVYSIREEWTVRPDEEFALELDAEIEEVRKELRRRAELIAGATSARGIEFWLESQKMRAEELARLLNQRSEMEATPRPEDRPDQVLDQQPSASRQAT